METELEFRPAHPQDDAAAIALIYSSGPSAFDYVFANRKHTAQDFLRFAFQSPQGEFGHGVHIVALHRDRIVAAAACYSGEHPLSFLAAAVRQIFSFYGPAAGLPVILRGLRMERLAPPPRGKLHYLAHVGVHPDFRRRGIGLQLIKHLLEQGRRANRKIAALDVAAGNVGARKLYERLGFEVTGEQVSRLPNVENLQRMELHL